MIIAPALVEVATELRLVDASALLAMIGAREEAAIADVVQSSAELYFRPGTLRYGLASSFDLGWGAPPTVSIDLEFRNGAVTAFLRMVLSGAAPSVHILDLCFEGAATDHATRARLLAEALANAREGAGRR